MKLKDLVLLHNVTMFYTDYIEEAPTIKDRMNNEPGILGQVCQGVHLRFQRLAAKLHDEKNSWLLAESDGRRGHFCLWDAYQDIFRDMTLFGYWCHRERGCPPLPHPDSVWYDTSDGDGADGFEPGNEHGLWSWGYGPGCCS